MRLAFFAVIFLSAEVAVCEDAVPALPKEMAFGETFEHTLWEDDPSLRNCLIDFDSNKVYDVTTIVVSAPHSVRFKKMREKAKTLGIDAYCEVEQSFAGLLGFHIVGSPVQEADWNPHYSTMEQLPQMTIGFPCPIAASKKLPATWIFRTDENYGVLQILEVVTDPKKLSPDGNGIRIRYKLLKKPN